jgi:hypothetical protein
MKCDEKSLSMLDRLPNGLLIMTVYNGRVEEVKFVNSVFWNLTGLNKNSFNLSELPSQIESLFSNSKSWNEIIKYPSKQQSEVLFFNNSCKWLKIESFKSECDNELSISFF